MSYGNCFFCAQTMRGPEYRSETITINTTMPASSRPLKSVLEHLANCIRTKLLFETETTICFTCFYELTDYDNLMVQLLASQKKLSSQLQLALRAQIKPDLEESENNSLNDDNFDNTSDTQLADAQNPDLDLKEELIEDDENGVIPERGGSIIELNNTSLEIIPTLFHHRILQECVLCGQSFKSKIQLENHAVEVHNVTNDFKCDICGVIRKDQEYLQLHMNIHEGKTELECRYCPKTFSRPVNTLRHMRKHWDKKEYQCEKCGERFSLDNMLYNHRLKHEVEDNPLICSICNQSFKSRKTYNHHQIIHQKHRPRYCCPVCPKSFTERYTLKMHVTTHSSYKEPKNNTTAATTIANTTTTTRSGEERSFCLICKTKFATKELLNVHLKDNHDVILK